MKTFFELVAGEALTLESLRFYLSTLELRARANSDTPATQLILANMANTTPDVALGALEAHIVRLTHAVYRPSKPNETQKQRKAEIDQQLAWFIYNLKDEAGVQVSTAVETLGMTQAELNKLISTELGYTDANLASVFGEAKRVAMALTVIPSIDVLFQPVPPAPLKPTDVELVRKWTNRYTAVAFAAQTVPLPDAFRCAQQRSATMAAIAERIGRADPDLKVYAKGQLETDGRIQAA